MDFIPSINNIRSKNYDRIKRLALKLQDPGNVNERRKLALELEQLMSSYDVRAALAKEATPAKRGLDDLSVAATRCLALSALWATVFTAAIGFTTGIVKGENGKKGVKPTPADIGFPDKLLRAAAGPDQFFERNGIPILKLNKKTVRAIAKFCLEMLDNDIVIECGGEIQMLEMLTRICSRPEYLGLVKDTLFLSILSEITCRLTEEVSTDIFLVSCKAFDAFYDTCSRLGYPVHMYLSDSLGIVSSFCRNSVQENPGNTARMHMFNAAASMLFAHPDHAMGPMKRYGRNILRLCKKAYANASPNHREAFDKYLLAHLFLAQVAGDIQGRLTGDLGDLGQASLSEKHLNDLLKLVVESTPKVLEISDSNKGIPERRAKKRKLSGETLSRSLDLRQKLHLELAARLLSCAQRLYLAREGRENMTDEILKSLVLATNPCRDTVTTVHRYLPEFPRLSLRVLSKSPWMSVVLRGLVTSLGIGAFSDTPTEETEGYSADGRNSLLLVIRLFGDNKIFDDNKTQEHEYLVSLLAIVAACSECFPSGECWASDPAKNWQRSNDEDVTHYYTASPSDLGLLLHVLSRLLEAYGRQDSEPTIQYWLLLSLAKLTETTPMIRSTNDYFQSGSQLIAQSWRKIWKILFRTDLQYRGHTALGENSLGEVFFVLLTEIVRRKCTESVELHGDATKDKHATFIFKNQSDAWTLQCLHSKAQNSSVARSTFEFILTIIRVVGLSEPPNRGLSDRESWPTTRSQRQRLVYFCLNCFEATLRIKTTVSIEHSVSKYRLASAIGICLVALSTATNVTTTEFSSQEPRFFVTTASYSHIQPAEKSNGNVVPASPSQLCLTVMWAFSPSESLESTNLSLETLCKKELDSPTRIASIVRGHLRKDECRTFSRTADFVSDQESQELCRHIFLFVDNKLSACLGGGLPSQTEGSEGSCDGDTTFSSLAAEVWAGKLVLSLIVAKNFGLERKLSERIPAIMFLLEKAVNELGQNTRSTGDYFSVSSDIRKTAMALIEIHTHARVSLGGIVPVVGICRAILRRYHEEINGVDQAETKKQSEYHTLTNDVIFSEDEDSDATRTDHRIGKQVESDSENSYDWDNSKQKSLLERKRRKTERKILSPPNCECALEIAKLLLVLDPTPSNASLVCEALLRTELDLEPESIQGDMDLRLAEDSVRLLRMKNVLLNSRSRQNFNLDFDSKNQSIVVIIRRTIDLVRACAAPFSSLFMFGVEACGQTLVDLSNMGLEISEPEEKLFRDILGEESDAFFARPSLAFQRLRSASHAFKQGTENFRTHFGVAFASIVKRGMGDGNFLVRRLAYKSAGVAMRTLDERRVLKSIADLTCPIGKVDTDAEIVSAFSVWFSKSPFVDLCAQQELAASDHMEVFESDAIHAKVIIAGCTQDTDTFRYILVEILRIPLSRPYLELNCFRSLERIACAKNYSSVEDLIESEVYALLAILFRKGDEKESTTEPNLNFSLCLTASVLMRWLRSSGQYDSMTGTPVQLLGDDECEDLRRYAMMRFISVNRGFLVPFLLIENWGDINMSQPHNDAMAKLSRSPKFRILLNMFPTESDDYDNIKKLLKQHVVDILAFCSPFLHSGDPTDESKGRAVQRILVNVLSEDLVKIKTSKNLSLLIRRILDLYGKAGLIKNVFPTLDEPYYRAVKSHILAASQSRNKNGDDFLLVGTSLTELAIYASGEMNKSSNHQAIYWEPFHILGRFLMDQMMRKDPGDNLQLGFFLHLATEILLKASLEIVRPRVLEMVRTILHESLHLGEEYLRTKTSSFVQRLLAVCYLIHESYQLSLLRSRCKKWYDTEMEMRRSCGIGLASNRTDGLWGWDELPDFLHGSEIEQAIVRWPPDTFEDSCLTATYDTIHLIVEKKSSFWLDPYIFESLCYSDEISEGDLDALRGIKAKYCAQTMARSHDRVSGEHEILQRCISRIDKTTKSPHGWVAMSLRSDAPLGSSVRPNSLLNIDQRLLHAELLQIEKLLGNIVTKDITGGDLKSLTHSLLYICNSSCPIKLRFAASRCLALLKPSIFVEAADIVDEHEPTKVHVGLGMLSVLHAKCIECLAESLKSSESKVSGTAMAILKGLLSTNLGEKVYNLVNDSSKSLIKPFVQKLKSNRSTMVALSDDELKSLMNGSIVEANDVLMWCWNSHLWGRINETDTDFEEWICTVTTAIILCCFRNPVKGDDVTNDIQSEVRDFFWRCQMGTFLDHRFASAVFPCLILAILDIENVKRNSGLSTTEENKEVTKAFQTLLQGSVYPGTFKGSPRASSRYKAVSLVIDTLDLTRKISQENFLSSRRKPSNPKKTVDPIPWEGLPFGIVLQLDGIDVATACMEVQRFASALFFLELYLNAQFGRVGGLFEDLPNELLYHDTVGLYEPCSDISGFQFHTGYHKDTGLVVAKSKALKAMSIAIACFKELHEGEAVSATEMQRSPLILIDGVLDHNIRGRLDSFSSIAVNVPKNLDLTERVNSEVVDALQELGLYSVMQAYIDGASYLHSGLKDICQEGLLREKWFESNLETQNWNKLAVQRGDEDSQGLLGMIRAEPEPNQIHQVGFFESVSKALKFFSREDSRGSEMYLKQARFRLMDSVTKLGGEHSTVDGVVDIIDKSRALKDLDALIEDPTLPEAFDYDEADLLTVSSGMRQVTLTVQAARFPERREFLEALKDHLWTSCTLAVDRGKITSAEKCLSRLTLLSCMDEEGKAAGTFVDTLRARYEEARIMECKGEFTAATHRMTQLVRHLLSLEEETVNPSVKGLLADAELLCGQWMTKYKTQQAKVVLETFLRPALRRAEQILESVNSVENANRLTLGSIQVGFVLANLFDSALSRVKSIEWKEAGERLVEQQQRLRESILALPKTSTSKGKESADYVQLNRFCGQLRMENENIEKERKQVQDSIPKYLRLALNAFILGFKTAGTSSDDLSNPIYRMVSLWFCAHEENLIEESLGVRLATDLCDIPSFRFVPLTNQLFSRIENASEGQHLFQRALHTVILKMCNDHPYHSLVPLITLAHGNSLENQSSQGSSKRTGDSKVIATKSIIRKLTRDGLPYVVQLVGSYEILIAAYNDTAYADVSDLLNRNRTKKVKFSELFKTSKGTTLDQCLRNCHPRPCVLTSPPLLRPTKDYGDGKEDPEGAERISGFEPLFDLTDSGIHRPKIVTCLGSQGGRFRQLVKGDDEVRQDAIMSQIFTYVNQLMVRGERDRRVGGEANGLPVESKRASRRIKIATYHIVPLSPMSGVLEWVQNTIPMMDYLEGPNSAHSRYYPAEWDYRFCARHMKGESSISKKGQSKKELFAQVCSKYSPCFRFFFMERFNDSAEAWHTAKMKYTRSVAINSIVGHVLGIGDRHLSNILIHTKTGAVVHIDFGIVFEQGKLLAIPELVPFRLTRNVVDGMGPCGTEGTFQSAAEETMLTLRNNSRDLLTILSAVVADPLYRWQTDSIEARLRQTEKDEDVETTTSRKTAMTGDVGRSRTKETTAPDAKKIISKDDRNQAAVKTIEKIKQKLEGYEESTFGDQQGVEGQVQLLINSARDPNLLKRMYVGWAPWI